MNGRQGFMSGCAQLALVVAFTVSSGFLRAEALPLTAPDLESQADASLANLQAHAEIVSARYDQAVQAGDDGTANLLAEVKRNIANTIQTIAPEAAEPAELPIVVVQVSAEQPIEPETPVTIPQPSIPQPIERIAQRERREHDGYHRDGHHGQHHGDHKHHGDHEHDGDHEHHRHHDRCKGEQCDRHEGGRHHHVRAAIRHLHAAGMHDVAERIHKLVEKRMAEKQRDDHADSNDRHPHAQHHKIAKRLKHALGEIRGHAEEHAERVEHLEERLNEQAEGMNEFMDEAEEWAAGFEEHIGERAEGFAERMEEMEEQVESLVEHVEHLQRHLQRRLMKKAEEHDQQSRRRAERQRNEAKMEAMNRHKEARILRDKLRQEVERRMEASGEETLDPSPIR